MDKHAKTAHHGFTHTHMEHHKDGSITIHHQHHDPEKDVKHAAANLDEAHDSMQANLGQPNPGEQEAMSPAEAGAAGLPAPGGQAA